MSELDNSVISSVHNASYMSAPNANHRDRAQSASNHDYLYSLNYLTY